MNANSILIVEDDENLRLALADNLEDEGYTVSAAATGTAGLELAREGDFDVVVLDIMLPDVDGYTICRELREAGVASMILMLTARSLEEDVVRGFDVGADDYLAKPYRLRELLARVRALMRRAAGRRGPAPPTSGALALGSATIDREARVVTLEGAAVDLTRTEFDLLVHFVTHPGKALSRDEILDAVWGEDVVVDPRTVDNFVSSLKKKLMWSRESPWRFKSVRGVGYRLEVD